MLSRKCPKCGRVALIRVERTYKANDYRTSYSCNVCRASWTTAHRPERKPPKRKHVERHYYCGACNHSWTVTDDGDEKTTRKPPPDRSRTTRR